MVTARSRIIGSARYQVVTGYIAAKELCLVVVEILVVERGVTASLEEGRNIIGHTSQYRHHSRFVRCFQQCLYLFIGNGVGGSDIQFFVTRGRGKAYQRKCYQIFFHNSLVFITLILESYVNTQRAGAHLRITHSADLHTTDQRLTRIDT